MLQRLKDQRPVKQPPKKFSRRVIGEYMRYLASTEPIDRMDEQLHMQDLRPDGIVWSKHREERYVAPPLGRTWTDDQEKALRRSEEAAARERRANTISFIVYRRYTPGS